MLNNESEATKGAMSLLRIVVTVIVLSFIFIEEWILKPFRKIKMILIINTVQKLSAFWTIASLVICKSIEGGIKIVMYYLGTEYPFISFSLVALDMFLGFISMNLIIYGRENLRTFRWYRKFSIFLRRLKREVLVRVRRTKSYAFAIYIFEVSKIYLVSWRLTIFGKQGGIIAYYKTYVRRLLYKYKLRKENT
ncbi:hypothetical protein HOF65_05060 [bacterium]|jgi:hypothetical protein|nr:hypothetical protein [bacterium]MBT3853324.1 hypothetical protein [bacterium]MBT4633469.1 hypothetical protein [bacterium]MBT5490993.1 hypothetical protein [bacterium]MBT6778963.1 hypothetical protein [bacterium]